MEPTEASALVPALQIIAGLVLLLLGRRLFWIFVGIIGFLAGVEFSADLLADQPEWILLLAAIVLGLIAAVLALVLQRVAVAIAGGLAGGILLRELAVAFGATAEPLPLVAFVIGAILAAVLVSLVFDWALIILSSLFGAAAIAGALPITGLLQAGVIIALLVLGIFVQSALLTRSKRTI